MKARWSICINRRGSLRNEAGFRYFHTIAREVSLDDPEQPETKTTKFRRALICTDPGPEEIVIQAEFFRRFLRSIDGLEPQQQALWARHFLDGVKLVELQEELGRTETALWQAVCRMRKRLPLLLAGHGLTPNEIHEYIMVFATFRAMRQEGQF